MATLHFPPDQRALIEPYLPPHARTLTTSGSCATSRHRPFVTLTYAQSLDSQIALSPGRPTALSGPGSKAMTHFLRSTHDAILIGSGTAIADDPSLNCRLDDVVAKRMAFERDTGEDPLAGQPRPVVLDRRGRWPVGVESKVVRLAKERTGRGPWVVLDTEAHSNMPREEREQIAAVGGAILKFNASGGEDDASFPQALRILAAKGIRSVMVEGGAMVINDMVSNYGDLIDSIIVTIAPVFMGQGGVTICPIRKVQEKPTVRLCDVHYLVLDQDVVMCGRVLRDEETS